MVAVLIIILIVGFFTFIEESKGKKRSFWKVLFQRISLKIVDYFCKGTPTKVVIITIRSLLLMYECIAIGYPLIKAGLKFDGTKSYWSLWLECQWDSVSSLTTYFFCGSIVVLCAIYLLTYKNEEKIEEQASWIKEAFNKVFGKLDNVQTSVTYIGNDITDIKTLMLSMSSSGLSALEHLIPLINESVLQLKVKTATKYLETIQKELEIASISNNKLASFVNYNLGLCARFMQDKECEPYFRKAYQQMKSAGIHKSNIIEAMVRMLCVNDKNHEIQAYIDELHTIDPNNIWCYIPSLLQAETLNEAYESLPNSIDKKNALAYTIMLEGKNENLGIEPIDYVYSDLDCIRVDNLQLWIMDLSVATTLFCQHLIMRRNVKDMKNDYSQKLFELTDRFIEYLRNTEIDNILPDTIFLHAFCGYLNNQSTTWLEIMQTAKYSESMKEIYYICYVLMLNDCGKYSDSLQLLKKYGDDTVASILNLRIQTAHHLNAIDDYTETLLYACEKKIIIYDHIAYFIFGVIGQVYEAVGDKINEIVFENELTRKAFLEYVKFVKSESLNIDFIKDNADKFSNFIIPYIALILEKHISLEYAIELLEKVVDKDILDIRSTMLIEFYLRNKKYTNSLYRLLTNLRHCGEANLRCLFIELGISSKLHDNDNCLTITRAMMERHPDDLNVLISHAQTLFASGNHVEEIIALESQFYGKTLPSKAVIVLSNIYIGIDEYQYALELLYHSIVTTQNQELKDYYLHIQINPNINRIISSEKDIIDYGDYILLKQDGKEIKTIVSEGSKYESLAGCKKGEKKVINIHNEIEVEITEIHTKYHKLLIDIYGEIKDSDSSKNIQMFSTKDFDFEKDPLGALMKITGNTEESRNKERTLRLQYHNGTRPLSCFINDNEMIPDLYDKIFGNFMVCTLPYQSFSAVLDKNKAFANFDIVLDLSSLLTLQELDARFNLNLARKFYISKGIMCLIKQQIYNEEKGLPTSINSVLSEKLTVVVSDKSKSLMWNKLKMLECWIENHCIVEIVEDLANYELDTETNLSFSLEIESLLQAKNHGILLTEDWYYTKNFANMIFSMNTYNWLVFMGVEKYEDCGTFLMDCGNVGYPMSKNYVYSHYNLFSSLKQNNYQTCLSNMKYYPLCWEEVLKAAKYLLMGIIVPAKQVGVTNMIANLFKNMDSKRCQLIISREILSSQDPLYHQCLFDALRISHPLILPE